jgi:hypothetical protein
VANGVKTAYNPISPFAGVICCSSIVEKTCAYQPLNVEKFAVAFARTIHYTFPELSYFTIVPECESIPLFKTLLSIESKRSFVFDNT